MYIGARNVLDTSPDEPVVANQLGRGCSTKPIFYVSLGNWLRDYNTINNKYYDKPNMTFYHCSLIVDNLSPVLGCNGYDHCIYTIAVDPISRLVYYTGGMSYTEIGDNFIAAVTFEGHHNFLLVTKRWSSISSIALDPKAG